GAVALRRQRGRSVQPARRHPLSRCRRGSHRSLDMEPRPLAMVSAVRFFALLFLSLTLAVGGSGCPSSKPPPARSDIARLPTEKEAGPEKVVVNYGPRLLRLFPTPPTGAAADALSQGYLILASERPELPAVFRPLGVTTQ